MKKINEYYIPVLQYIKNTGYNVTPEQFDEDHEPIGPSLRAAIIPKYARINSNGRIELTDEGFSQLVPP